MKRRISILVLCLILVSASLVRADEMRVSPDTLVLVNNTWVPASQLQPGDIFMTPDEKKAIVRDVEDVDASENTSCYGFLTTHPTTAAEECSPTSANVTPPGAESTQIPTRDKSLLEILLAIWRRLLRLAP